LLFSLFYYPVSAALEDKSSVGIVRLVVQRVEELRATEAAPCSALVAKVRLGWDEPPILVTPRRKLSNGTAAWEATHEFLCFDNATCVLYIDVLNNLKDSPLGHLSVCLMDLVEATIARRGPWPLSGSTTAKLFISRKSSCMFMRTMY